MLVHGASGRLLRRHVGDGAQHRSLPGHPGHGRQVGQGVAAREDLFGKPEIEDLHLPVASDHHVLGLRSR